MKEYEMFNQRRAGISPGSGLNEKPSLQRPWLKHYPPKSRDRPMVRCTIYEALSEMCNKHPNEKALYYYGTSITYSGLLRKIDELADSYYGIGVREGETVSLLMPTTPESIFSLYALNKIGAIPNFIDPRMDPERILNAVSGVKSKLFVTMDFVFSKVEEIRDRLEVEKIVVSSASTTLPIQMKIMWNLRVKSPDIQYGGDVLRWKDLISSGRNISAKKITYKENSVAAITYTGGTTGTPKGVLLTNDGLNTMAQSFVLSGVDANIGERFLEIMPIFASYGVGCGVHMPLSLGFELVVIPKFTPPELGKLIRKYKPGHMMAVPSFYEQIMHSRDLWDVDLSFLKTTGCGGETMNDGLQARFNAFLREHGGKYPLSQGYGMSEMSGAATCCFSAVYKDGSAGIPLLATTVGIFDPETGEELGYGQQGEICMTGRNMMLGYYDNEAETAQVMRRHEDGTVWIHSGDIGYMDEDGFVFIKGRIKQIIIKFDGHKVFPVSLEAVINSHKSVAECAVVGIPDPDHVQGEVPLVLVKLKDSALNTDKELLRRNLFDMCEELCEERGKPADIEIVSGLPYTTLGKHDYRTLTEQYRNHVIRTQ